MNEPKASLKHHLETAASEAVGIAMQGAHDRPAESPRELANSGLANIKHGLCHNLKSGDRRAAANALVYAASFLLRAAVWLRRTP